MKLILRAPKHLWIQNKQDFKNNFVTLNTKIDQKTLNQFNTTLKQFGNLFGNFVTQILNTTSEFESPVPKENKRKLISISMKANNNFLFNLKVDQMRLVCSNLKYADKIGRQ